MMVSSLIARAVVERPELLILDEAFIGTDEKTKLKILSRLFYPNLPWTIVNISHDAEVVIQTDKIFVLQEGSIVESGDARDLAKDSESVFSNAETAGPVVRKSERMTSTTACMSSSSILWRP